MEISADLLAHVAWERTKLYCLLIKARMFEHFAEDCYAAALNDWV